MEKSISGRQRKQGQALEEAYRRGYHHGLTHARELLLRLLNEGMPPVAAMELCRIYVIWRIIVKSLLTNCSFGWYTALTHMCSF